MCAADWSGPEFWATSGPTSCSIRSTRHATLFSPARLTREHDLVANDPVRGAKRLAPGSPLALQASRACVKASVSTRLEMIERPPLVGTTIAPGRESDAQDQR